MGASVLSSNNVVVSSHLTTANNVVNSSGNIYTSNVDADNVKIRKYKGNSLTDCVTDIDKRLELLESNVKALPAIIGETIISAFRDIQTQQMAPVFTINGGYTELPNMTAGRSVYLPGNTGTTTGMGVDLSPALSTMVGMVIQQLSAKINYDELNSLRDRIRQLEEDMGYREAVAKKLMEP
jgi:hypothetical protein